MKLNAYTIRDNKIGQYHTPFFSSDDVVASRQLAMACKDKNTQLSNFPEDFDLWKIGVFDDETAGIVGCQPTFIVGAISFQKVN